MILKSKPFLCLRSSLFRVCSVSAWSLPKVSSESALADSRGHKNLFIKENALPCIEINTCNVLTHSGPTRKEDKRVLKIAIKVHLEMCAKIVKLCCTRRQGILTVLDLKIKTYQFLKFF